MAQTWLRAVEPKYHFGQHVLLQAQVTALLGQRDDALRLLLEAKAQFAAPVVGFNPLNLRKDPEFKALLADPKNSAPF